MGDRYADLEMAHRVGAKGILVMTGYGRGEYELHRGEWPRQPDRVEENLARRCGLDSRARIDELPRAERHEGVGVERRSQPPHDLVEAFPQQRVVLLGDFVADQYVSGEISRVSREAPVLIIRHRETQLAARRRRERRE